MIQRTIRGPPNAQTGSTSNQLTPKAPYKLAPPEAILGCRLDLSLRTHRPYAGPGQIRIPSHGRDPRRPISSQIESRRPIFSALELPLWWRAVKVPLQLSVGRNRHSDNTQLSVCAGESRTAGREGAVARCRRVLPRDGGGRRRHRATALSRPAVKKAT